MDALGILLGIGVVIGLIATPIMLMVALARLGDLRRTVEELRMMVFSLRGEREEKGLPSDSPQMESAEVTGDKETGGRPQTEVAGVVGDKVAEERPPMEVAEVVEDQPQIEVAEVAENSPQMEVPAEPIWGEVMMERFADWLAVRGKYAPEGMTREFAVATRWLVRVGLALLVGSLIYFVKLSIDNGWMGPTARVMGTLFWGAVGVAGGVALVKRTRYGLIGHALAALGIVALYLGFGLGHRFFNPPVIASWQLSFAALVGVTVIAGFVAVMLPSSTIAVMGLVGGYLVPVIAGQDTGRVLGLCAYLFVLNVGASVVASFRKGQGLNLLASIFAYVMMFGWGCMHAAGSSTTVVTVWIFLSLVHALYLVTAVRMARIVDNQAGTTISWLGIAINALFYLSWLGAAFRPAMSDGVTGLVFLGVVAAYLALARHSLRAGWLNATSVNLLLVFALVFLSLAPLLLFAVPWCAVSWALIAIACAEVGSKQRLKVLSVLSALLICIASGAAILFGLDAYCTTVNLHWHHGGEVFLRIVRIGVIPVAVGFLGFRTKIVPLIWAAGVMAFLFLTGEAHRMGAELFPAMGGGTVTLAWGITAALCLWGGIIKRFTKVRLVGLFLMGIAVAKLLLFDTSSLSMPYRVMIFAITGVLLMAGAFLYLKFKARFEGHE